jgi:hypothetical protein
MFPARKHIQFVVKFLIFRYNKNTNFLAISLPFVLLDISSTFSLKFKKSLGEKTVFRNVDATISLQICKKN